MIGKKTAYVAMIAALFFPLFAFADAPYLTTSGTSIIGAGLNGNCSGPNGKYAVYIFDTVSGNNVSGNALSSGRNFNIVCATGNFTEDIVSDFGFTPTVGTHYTVVVLTSDTNTNFSFYTEGTHACGTGSTLSTCQGNWGYSPDSSAAASVDYYEAPPAPPSGSSFPDMIAAADSGFASTTGFHVAGVLAWSGDNLIRLFIGSGVAIIYELRYWIIVAAIIGAIIFFSLRGFRFFRH